MIDSKRLASATRRVVLATIAAALGTGSAAASERAAQLVEVDADNLVAGNRRLTITLDGVRGSAVEEATVVIGGVAFATVAVLERDPAVLVVDASNLVRSESMRRQDAVEVAIVVDVDGRRLAGIDESQVIVE